MPLSNLDIVLFRPKYPENIGSVARAMLNMGAQNLVLVEPQDFDLEKAAPLATFHARHILASARILPGLREALGGTTLAIGTTARTGGWRKGLLRPDTAAAQHVLPRLAEGGRVALVFGPEDRGLTNEETSLCDQLVMIPAHPACTSLNLSQAVLILLYECYVGSLAQPFEPKGPPTERDASFEERDALFASMQAALSAIGYLKDQNQDYWMLPVRRFFARFRLRRNEFNLLMGVCRQVRWVAGRAGLQAGAQAGAQAGVDAAADLDAGAQGCPGAGACACADAAADAQAGAGVEACAGVEARTVGGADAGAFGGADAGVDADADAGVDAGKGAGRAAGG